MLNMTKKIFFGGLCVVALLIGLLAPVFSKAPVLATLFGRISFTQSGDRNDSVKASPLLPIFALQISQATIPGPAVEHFATQIPDTVERPRRLAKLYARVAGSWSYKIEDPDSDRDTLWSADQVIQRSLHGDCTSQSVLYAALARRERIRCRIVLAEEPDNASAAPHCYTEWQLSGGGRSASPTLRDLATVWKCEQFEYVVDADGSCWLSLNSFPPKAHAARRQWLIDPSSGTFWRAGEVATRTFRTTDAE